MKTTYLKHLLPLNPVHMFGFGLSISAMVLFSPAGEVLAHNSGSEATRPFFQAPYPCGQIWQAKTYSGHSPDEDSIDLSEYDSNGLNSSDGHPVLASAAGTVIKSLDSGASGGWGVVIDHGEGWITGNSYHMQEDNPWPIAVGQKVAQGEQLGRTGNTGATSVYHQHYTQLDHYHLNSSDKNSVRVKFNGNSISTHAGDPGSWHTGEEILSQNCAGNTFMGWYRAGVRYNLIYKPSSGETKIIHMNPDGSVATTYDKDWSKGWSHFIPFYNGSGHPHAIVYKQKTGEVKFLRMGLNGDSVTTLSSGYWAPGWTHFVPFSKNGSHYFLAYDSVHGYANIDRIWQTSDGSSKMYSSSSWIKGRTAIVPYIQGPNRYLLLYKGGNGKANIVKITGEDENISTTPVWNDNWSTGYSYLVPIIHQGARYLFGYKAETGFAKIMKFKPNGQGVRTIKSMNWSKSWTAFSPFSTDSKGNLLIYKIGTGEVKTLRLKPNANGFDTIWSGSWTLGWT